MGAEGEGGAEGERDERRGSHPEPDAGQNIPAIDLDEVGHEDADDERGLEAFAEADQVVREHRTSSLSWRAGRV